jgi:hypothetical protein
MTHGMGPLPTNHCTLPITAITTWRWEATKVCSHFVFIFIVLTLITTEHAMGPLPTNHCTFPFTTTARREAGGTKVCSHFVFILLYWLWLLGMRWTHCQPTTVQLPITTTTRWEAKVQRYALTFCSTKVTTTPTLLWVSIHDEGLCASGEWTMVHLPKT